jgi:hypothetical protein
MIPSNLHVNSQPYKIRQPLRTCQLLIPLYQVDSTRNRRPPPTARQRAPPSNDDRRAFAQSFGDDQQRSADDNQLYKIRQPLLI